MQRLLQAINTLVSNSPPNKIEQLAELIRQASSPSDTLRINRWALAPAARTRLSTLLSVWKMENIPPSELAGMVLGASHAYHFAKSEESVELVWTGPSSELVATRKTRQALLQVIHAARTKLFLTSFVAYKVGTVVSALQKAVDRGVSLSMLLESSEQHGGGVSIDGIAAMKGNFPTAKIYFWGDKSDEFSGGKVHAKVAVADENVCFISSANLTGHAMERNMEAGVLVEGGAIPLKLHRHLEALVTTNQLTLS